MRITTLPLVTSLLLGLAVGGAAAQKTQLLVYTALETDQLKAYQEGFNKVEPNIEIKWVRDSTGGAVVSGSWVVSQPARSNNSAARGAARRRTRACFFIEVSFAEGVRCEGGMQPGISDCKGPMPARACRHRCSPAAS